jgi:hypothetical protein
MKIRRKVILLYAKPKWGPLILLARRDAAAGMLENAAANATANRAYVGNGEHGSRDARAARKAYLQSHQLAAGRSQENKLIGGTRRCEEELLL